MKQTRCIALLLLLISLFISGCGFHLRHPAITTSSLNRLHLVILAENAHDFNQALSELLARYGISRVSEEADSQLQVRLLAAGLNQQRLSTNREATTSQLLLSYKITYQLRDPQGQWGQPQTVSQIDNALGSDNELASFDRQREAIITRLRNNAIEQWLNKLSHDYGQKHHQ
jgi:outer membrane lipopolysaccharide assembly protein LptE/RlpB